MRLTIGASVRIGEIGYGAALDGVYDPQNTLRNARDPLERGIRALYTRECGARDGVERLHLLANLLQRTRKLTTIADFEALGDVDVVLDSAAGEAPRLDRLTPMLEPTFATIRVGQDVALEVLDVGVVVVGGEDAPVEHGDLLGEFDRCERAQPRDAPVLVPVAHYGFDFGEAVAQRSQHALGGPPAHREVLDDLVDGDPGDPNSEHARQLHQVRKAPIPLHYTPPLDLSQVNRGMRRIDGHHHAGEGDHVKWPESGIRIPRSAISSVVALSRKPALQRVTTDLQKGYSGDTTNSVVF